MNPHPWTLRQLQYAVALADTLSFRRAAERCRVSQPALSAQLAQLEQALKVRLFERDRRRVLVTDAGRQLIEHARRLLASADDLTVTGHRLSDPEAGEVAIGVIPTVSPYLLHALAPVVRQRFPRLTARWIEDKTERLLEDLVAGRLDAAVIATKPVRADLESRALLRDPFVVALPAGHALARHAELRAAQVAGEPLLLLDEGHCLREQAQELCGAPDAQDRSFRATSLGALLQMVAAGQGLTLLPGTALVTPGPALPLETRPLRAGGAERIVRMVWRKTSPVAAIVSALAEAMTAPCRAVEERIARAVPPADRRPRPPSASPGRRSQNRRRPGPARSASRAGS